jgi:hypothetical protein
MIVIPLSTTVADPSRDESLSALDIAIPVRNEAAQLPASAGLRTYLDQGFPFTATITIVDNASTDETPAIALGLAAILSRVRSPPISPPRPSRGSMSTTSPLEQVPAPVEAWVQRVVGATVGRPIRRGHDQ